MFDVEAFKNTPVQGANSTDYIPFPEGEYPGVVEDYDVRVVDTKNGPGTTFEAKVKLDVTKSILDEIGMNQPPTFRFQCWLDITEQGGLDLGKGKNVKLGQLREAVGLNNPAVPFNFDQLKGRPLRVKTKNVPGDRGGVFTNITHVTKLA